MPMTQEFEVVLGASQNVQATLAQLKEALAAKNGTPAVDAAEKIVREAKEAGNKVLEGAALAMSIGAYMLNEDGQEAIEAAEGAIAIFKELNDKTKTAFTQMAFSECLLAQGGAYDAVHLAEQALMLFRQERNSQGQGAANIAMSKAYVAIGEFDKAAYRAEGGANVYKKANDVLGEASALRAGAQAFLGKKQSDPKASNAAREALRLAKSALTLLEARKDDSSVDFAYAVLTVGSAEGASGNMAKAMELVQQAQGLFTDLNDMTGKAETYKAMAQIFFDQGDTVEAVSAARDAQSFFLEAGDEYNSAVAADMAEYFQIPADQRDQEGKDQIEVAKKKGPDIDFNKNDVWEVDDKSGMDIFFCDAYQVRGATAPTQRSGRSVEEKAVAATGAAAGPAVEVLYAIRYVKAGGGVMSAAPEPMGSGIATVERSKGSFQPTGTNLLKSAKAEGLKRGQFPQAPGVKADKIKKILMM